MDERRPDDGLAWMGRHAFTPRLPKPVPGMRAGISLTAIRGADPAGFLLRLRALRESVEQPVAYRDFRLPEPLRGFGSPLHEVAMHGTCGEWTFVLDDHGAATWFLAQFDVPEALPRRDEELVCLTLNRHDSPCLIAYSPPGIDGVYTAEFGEGLLEFRHGTPEDPAGAVAAFDEALARAGAVHSRLDPARSWRDVVPAERNAPVFRAVGDHFGITVDRDQVEQGLLPAVALPLP
ncbi:hypothetical protein [Streptomyces sp. NPDC021020]|uniref:hypothetical protein n=1 Tax=Streptomyces sp. NPDC021020 TaxID=3365109 RepID=UPI00378940B0